MTTKNAKALVNRGSTELEWGHYRQALNLFDKALAIDPKDVTAWYNRASALSHMRRYQEALESYDKALAIDPSDAEAWRSRGSILSQMGREQDAADSYAKAMAIDTKNANILVKRRKQDAMDWKDKISFNFDIMGGKPVIKGTRVPVQVIVGSLAGGMTLEEVCQEYTIQPEQARAALAYAAQLLAEERVYALSP